MSPTEARSSSVPGLYLHIPYCSAICPYCDFAVRKGQTGHGARFVETLTREIRGLRSGELLPEAHDLADVLTELVDTPFDTVYLGGGTPSFLSTDELGTLFDALFRVLDLDSESRFFFEANPEDITTEQLQEWRSLGISTLSLGVQSLDDASLRFLGRRHSANEARSAVEAAKREGFETVSVDLIYGLPAQTPESWDRQLQAAIDLGADHLSLYELEIHPRTAFGKRQAAGEQIELSQAAQAELFLRTHDFLINAEWDAYEVSNFARTPEHRSRHNQKYWRHVPYLGLGPSAHSFAGGWRFWNESLEPKWRDMVNEGTSPAAGWEKPPASAIALEHLMLGLRVREGVDLKRLQPLLSIDFLNANASTLSSWAEQDLLHMVQDTLVPTTAGMAVADRLASELVLDDASSLHAD